MTEAIRVEFRHLFHGDKIRAGSWKGVWLLSAPELTVLTNNSRLRPSGTSLAQGRFSLHVSLLAKKKKNCGGIIRAFIRWNSMVKFVSKVSNKPSKSLKICC